MAAVTKLGKGIASLADARAAKEAKERRRADLTERLIMTQQARAETETAKKMAWDEVKGMEAAHPGLHDLVRSGKEVEWLSNADKLMHTRGVDRGVFYDTMARKYGLPEGEAAKQAIDEFFDAIEHLTKANKDIKSFSEREAKLDAALKKLSATVGIPPATLMAEIQQPESGVTHDAVTTPTTSESQRIEDEYGLSTQAMLDRYQPQAPKTHTESYSQTMNPNEAFTGGAEALRYGVGRIPGSYPELGAFLAPYSWAGQLGFDAPERKLNEWADQSHAYFNEGVAEPTTPWQNTMALTGEIGGDIAAWTGLGAGAKLAGKGAKVVDQGVKSLRKGTAAAKAAPGTVDETRRAIVTGTPAVAATAGIVGLTGLKALTKTTNPFAKAPFAPKHAADPNFMKATEIVEDIISENRFNRYMYELDDVGLEQLIEDDVMKIISRPDFEKHAEKILKMDDELIKDIAHQRKDIWWGKRNDYVEDLLNP